MSEWRNVALADVSTKIGSGATPRGGKEAYRDEGIALIRSMNVLDEGFHFAGLARISAEQAGKLTHVSVEAGDVLVNITGASVARCCIAPRSVLPARVNQHVAIIRLRRDQAIPRFVSAYLTSAEGKGRLLNLASAGATREALTKAMLEHFTIRIPDLATQRRSAAVLEALDDLIENNRQRVGVSEEMARAIYSEWFVRFRYPGRDDVPLVGSPLGPIPEGWDTGTVANLCERIQAGGTPRRSEPTFWSPPEVDWYKTGDLTDSVLVHSSEQISERALIESTARSFEPETVLMAIYGSPTVGRLGLVEDVSSANQAALGLVANRERSSTEHLWFVLEGLREHLNQVAQGAAQQNVSKAKVAEAPALIPPSDVVAAFTHAIAPSWRCTHRLIRQNYALAGLRDLLLPKLVTGRVDLSRLDLDSLTEAATA